MSEDDFDDEFNSPPLPVPDDELLKGRHVFTSLITTDNELAITAMGNGELDEFPLYEFDAGRYVLVKLPDEEGEDDE